MAPIPKDNDQQEDHPPPSEDDDDFPVSSFNMSAIDIASDSSSDDNDDAYTNNTNNYMLLSQDPDHANNSCGESEDSVSDNDDNSGNGAVGYVRTESSNISGNGNKLSSVISDQLPEEVIQNGGEGPNAPTLNLSTASVHPELFAKFPDGKAPSYMQVPENPRNKNEDILWNKKRLENKPSIDCAQEISIRKAMASFSLPTENVPDWAKEITSDQWHKVIANQIGSSTNIPEKRHSHRTDRSSTSQKNQHSDNKVQEDWVAEFPET